MSDFTPPTNSLWQMIAYMLKLGSMGFGGPVALVGYMYRDLVSREQLALSLPPPNALWNHSCEQPRPSENSRSTSKSDPWLSSCLHTMNKLLFRFQEIAVSALFVSACSLVPVKASAADSELRHRLEVMFKEDQAIRKELTDVQKELLSEKDALKKVALEDKRKQILEKMRINSRSNQISMAAILQNGWPRITEVGAMGMMTIFLSIQHGDLEFQKAQLENVRQAAIRGDIPKMNLASLEDRIRVQQELPQLYGTQIKATGGKVGLFPVENESELDVRRAQMGLDPICSYLERFSATYGPITYPGCLKLQ